MTTKVLMIDNYDSFTYNLVQALSVLGAEVVVHRNDAVDVEALNEIQPTHLVISPGPGRPDGAGRSLAITAEALHRMPVLGVCLGHQTLAAVCGASIDAAQRLMHGKSSPVYHDGRTLFEGLPNPFLAGRYHSLSVAEPSLPDTLVVTAYTSEGEIMGVRHRHLPAEGVQFHPESILTPEGSRLLENFLDFEINGAGDK